MAILTIVGWLTAFIVIGIFILIGVGSDDLFVFWDAWAQARRFYKISGVMFRSNGERELEATRPFDAKLACM